MTGATRTLARFALEAAPPDAVRQEAVRAFVNFVGCALGGARHDAVERTFRTAAPFAGAETVTLIGRAARLGPLDAALVNCQASAAHAFDDTHLATVIHPAGPVAAPLLAEAERRGDDGAAVIDALAVGIEVACRMASVLVTPPAEAELGWYMTGVACPLGAAAAVARLKGFDETQTMNALGLAASQAAGFRNSHGTMCTSLVPALASRSGYWAALLAAEGVDCSETALEGANGYAALFSRQAWLDHATDALGDRWEMLENMPKPYPCGIVIHPALGACLEIAAEPDFRATDVAAVELGVDPLCLTLCDRPDPPSAQLAQVSVQHWTAAALVRAAAGLAEGTEAAVHEPQIAAMRAKVVASPRDDVGREGAAIRVTMAGGAVFERRVEHAVGSRARPMTDADIDAKFLAQAETVLPQAASKALLTTCRAIAEAGDVRGVALGVVP